MQIWRDIPGYEGLYKASNDGQVLSVRRNKLMALHAHPRGYRQVTLRKDGRSRAHLVHRLVAAAFLGAIPQDLQVNHKDGRKDNDDISNLEIVTQQENHRHGQALGLIRSNRGEDNLKAKLTEEKVREMRRLYQQKVPARDIARQFGVSQRMVHKIVARESWQHVA